MQADVNPMQLYDNPSPNLDLRHNIQGAVDHYMQNSHGGRDSFEASFARYGGIRGGVADYPKSMTTASAYVSQINNSKRVYTQ
jgi:hypothetical protein